MGKKDTKKKDESKETKSKKKKKDDVPLVHINGNAGKENEGFDEEEEEKHNIDKAKKKKISKPEQLCAAAYSGQKEDVEKLLDKGVGVDITPKKKLKTLSDNSYFWDINYRDEYGKSPLHHATSGKQHQIVELLLRRGADVTLQDQRGDTPLHAAVRAGDEPSVKTLLSNERCNVSAEGRSLCTPLHIACGMDKLSICRVLVDHNASITAKDEDQMTPLGHSVEKGARRTAAYMFEVADSQLGETEPLLYDADSDGSTLLHMAVDSGVTEIVEMCLKHGARVREPKMSTLECM
ncbi:Ankyrin-2 [Exaiptasia diaphana]|nr:Ankyrin-2 [Exaiptasia diaphana]